MFGTSSCVSGTGFLFSSEIARENGGWKHFLLTEDFEFTVDRILKDDTVGYCENAIIYDEQPTRLGQSLHNVPAGLRAICRFSADTASKC